MSLTALSALSGLSGIVGAVDGGEITLPTLDFVQIGCGGGGKFSVGTDGVGVAGTFDLYTDIAGGSPSFATTINQGEEYTLTGGSEGQYVCGYLIHSTTGTIGSTVCGYLSGACPPAAPSNLSFNYNDAGGGWWDVTLTWDWVAGAESYDVSTDGSSTLANTSNNYYYFGPYLSGQTYYVRSYDSETSSTSDWASASSTIPPF